MRGQKGSAYLFLNKQEAHLNLIIFKQHYGTAKTF